jgi:hypothetical protein
MDRATLTAPSPGSLSNGVTLVSGADKCAFGVGHPTNVGQVGLTLAALNASGSFVDYDNLGPFLFPNDSLPFYTPPTGTTTIILMGDPSGVGAATLEYDLPIA